MVRVIELRAKNNVPISVMGMWYDLMGHVKMSPEEEVQKLNMLLAEKRITWKEAMRMYYVSKRWMSIRRAALKRDKYTCVLCGSTLRLHVDHKIYPSFIGGEEVEDVQVLCSLCHAEKTTTVYLNKGIEDLKVKKSSEANIYEMFRA
jgi:hypothetical protein